MNRKHVGAVLSVALAVSLAVTVQAGTAGAAADTSPLAPVSTDALAQKYLGQAVSWKYDNCTSVEKTSRIKADSALAYRTVECADITVPVNYLEPDRASITVHALRVGSQMSAGEQPRTLFVNRGGPGGSAGSFALRLAGTMPDLLQTYQIIGVDPRGTGASSPIDCPASAQRDLDTFRPSASIASSVDVDCLGKYTHAAFLSTENVARDFDLVRRLTGASLLDYYGVSYGTKLGRVYQSLFPAKSGRVVLDSNTTAPGVPEPSVTQNDGFKRRGTQLTEWLARQNKTYQLGTKAATVTASYGDILKAAERGNLPNISRQDIENSWQQAVYSDAGFQNFAQSLTLAKRYLANDPGVTFTQVRDQMFSAAAQSAVYTPTEYNSAAGIMTVFADLNRAGTNLGWLLVGADWKLTASTLAFLKVQLKPASGYTGPPEAQLVTIDRAITAFKPPPAPKPDPTQQLTDLGIVLDHIAKLDRSKPITDRSPFADGEFRTVPGAGKTTGGQDAAFALMLQNEFDAPTPWENATALLTYFPNSKLVAVRGAGGHGVMPALNSAVSGSVSCAGAVVARYLQRGERPPTHNVCAAAPMPGDKASAQPVNKTVAPGALIDPWQESLKPAKELDVKITSPADAATVADRRPVIKGTGVPGATVYVKVETPFNSGNWQHLDSVTVGADGAWSVTPASDFAVGATRFEAWIVKGTQQQGPVRSGFTVTGPQADTPAA